MEVETTPFALVESMMSKKLDAVKWLHANRSEE
jgi:hypothetical protein